jgi:hypothetical protein
MEFHALGKALIVVGVFLALAGGVILLMPRIPWLGRLPGDVFIKRGNFTFYFPLATCLLLSLAISLAVRMFKK